MRIDVHQHLWTEPLLERLAGRETLPLVRRTNGLAVLHTAYEQPCVLDLTVETLLERAALVRRDGLEALPRDDALELIDAHLEGMGELPEEFAVWGPLALDGAGPDQVDRLAARGCIGVSVPAGALSGPERMERIGSLLDRAAEHRLPVLVHPGPARGDHAQVAYLGEPLWWRALTSYVAQMQAAWLTFVTLGRRAHPDLTLVFAMLAGGAPLLSERLEARGGPPIDLRDPRVFYETSSYGPDAVTATAGRVGERQLLYGSDRPVVVPPAPTPGAVARQIRLQENAATLFAPVGVPA